MSSEPMPNQTASTSLDFCRKILTELIKTHPNKPNLKNLSLALGRNAAYLHQFIHRGSPRVLPEEVRYRLADMLDVDESLLRQDSLSDGGQSEAALSENVGRWGVPTLLSIEFFDHPSQVDACSRPWLLPSDMLSRNRIDNVASLRLAVVGDSNADQSIHSGDVVMFDLSDSSPHRAGLFCIDGGDHIRVRHLESPETEPPVKYVISHDSGIGYVVEDSQITILGRVIFHSRMLEAVT